MAMSEPGQAAGSRKFGRAGPAAPTSVQRPGGKPDAPAAARRPGPAPKASVVPLKGGAKPAGQASGLVLETKRRIQSDLMDRLDFSKVALLSPEELRPRIRELVADLLDEKNIACSRSEQEALVSRLVDDMVGLGPLEPLMGDDSVTDIMVNGAHRIFVERKGKLELTDLAFESNKDVMNLAIRIATRAGRRIDETSPLVDARLKDGSRVNIIVPPLAIDGPSISIRKFSRQALSLDAMIAKGTLSPAMAGLLMVAGASRLNVLVSGGTGSGKTTMLNAISEMISVNERIVTIEDAAELKLMQPHVVRLETRPANLEGKGEIRMRDLVKNALRMRPDRIIVGEVRGDEVVDMLQAMNTGHEGSLGTLHANSPRHALTRLENLFAMAGLNLSNNVVRRQIAEALDLVVHTERMRDGVRRITRITEIVGTESETILTQDLFTFEYTEQADTGAIRGKFVSAGLQPRFIQKARYVGLEKELLAAIHGSEARAA